MTLDTKPMCPPPLQGGRRPRYSPPPGAWDSHCHTFGPLDRYPPAETATHVAPEASLADYRALLDRLGLAKGVVVTSTVYGTDNRLLMENLAEAGAWLRGIAVIDNSVTDAELEAMDRAGIRGFRINFMAGSRGDHFRGGSGPENLEPLAERTKDLGWHVQMWCDCRDLPDLRARLAALPVPVVVDHFGRIPTDRGADDPGFLALRDMVAAGETFCKISGAYRLSRTPPDYPDTRPFAEALLRAAPDRLVWGTDWPHPNCVGQMPDDADLLDTLAGWCDDDAALLQQILVDTPERLYG